MTRAADLGRGARRAASPNPGVGCVIAALSGEVFEGATRPPGSAHAEAAALEAARAANADLIGATAWVTLEPCSHQGRTGPCADALAAAGVARVVVALEDPDPQVAGQGIQKLRDAGVVVEVGVNADEVAQDLTAYLTHRRTGRPYVTLKLAMTTDGATTTDPPGGWITGPEARADTHRLRAETDAILVGAGTVRTDNPRLTTRDAAGPDPIRIVLGHAAPDAAVQPCLERTGDIGAILKELGSVGIMSLLLEGGEHVAAQFRDADRIDRYVLYVAHATPPVAERVATKRWPGRVVDVTQIGHDVRVTLVPETQA